MHLDLLQHALVVLDVDAGPAAVDRRVDFSGEFVEFRTRLAREHLVDGRLDLRVNRMARACLLLALGDLVQAHDCEELPKLDVLARLAFKLHVNLDVLVQLGKLVAREADKQLLGRTQLNLGVLELRERVFDGLGRVDHMRRGREEKVLGEQVDRLLAAFANADVRPDARLAQVERLFLLLPVVVLGRVA